MILDKETYDSIMREYNEKRFQAFRDLDIRRDQLYSRFPELSEIEQALSINAASRARAKILGNQEVLVSLEIEAEKLKAQKDSIYQRNRIPKNYLEANFSCQKCQDTGYVNNHRCTCLTEKIIKILYGKSGLETTLQQENFKTLSMEYYNQNIMVGSRTLSEYMSQTIAKCKQFAFNFDRDHPSILFYGPTGTGKTFLINCIAKELLDTCHSVLYFSAIELYNQFSRNHLINKDEDFNEALIDCDLLIIDDLGTEYITGFTEGKLFYCINDRLLQNKSTIISTNLATRELRNTYGERIYSRIVSGFTLIRLDGADIRIKKKFRQ